MYSTCNTSIQDARCTRVLFGGYVPRPTPPPAPADGAVVAEPFLFDFVPKMSCLAYAAVVPVNGDRTTQTSSFDNNNNNYFNTYQE